MRTIDLHAHVTPRCLIEAKAAGTRLHGIEPSEIARGLGRAITPAQRVADLDRLCIDRQVVSAEPQVYCYQYPASSAAAIHRECNDEIHGMTTEHPDRFSGLAVLPMQDVPSAVAELDRAMTDLGFSAR